MSLRLMVFIYRYCFSILAPCFFQKESLVNQVVGLPSTGILPFTMADGTSAKLGNIVEQFRADILGVHYFTERTGPDRTKFTHYFTERNGRHTLIEQSSYYNTLIEQSSYIAQAIAKLQ